MKRIENILLSRVPVWIVVVLLALAAAGTVGFGALVREATTHTLEYYGKGHFLGRVAVRIAEIPETLSRLLSESHPAEAQRQRFNGRTGLDFTEPPAPSGDAGGEEGYLLLVRLLPKPRFMDPKGRTTLLELIDLSRRKTVHDWRLNLETDYSLVFILPDGSLIVRAREEDLRVTIRLDVCSNVAWKKRFELHHSLERDADGNFWGPARIGGRHRMSNRKEGLIKFSPSGEVLARVSLTDALVRNGYLHLVYHMHSRLHVNDVQPVLRDGPFWRRGDLFVSLRNPSIVLLYRPAAEKVVWLRAGPWLRQHDVDVVSDSEISVFSNNTVGTSDGRREEVLGANEVYVYDFSTGEVRSPWREAMRRHEVRTKTRGGATLFDDGGLMVQENDFGRVLRLSADGAIRWSYVNRASDGRVYQLGWNRYLDADYGAEIMRSVAAADCTGSGPQAGAAH